MKGQQTMSETEIPLLMPLPERLLHLASKYAAAEWPELQDALVEASEGLTRLSALNAELVGALAQLVRDYEDVPEPTDADGQAVFDRARAALSRARKEEGKG